MSEEEPKPINGFEIVKVFKVVDSDFPDYPLYVPHTLQGLRSAMEGMFPDDEILDDIDMYDCDGDHHVTITHEWMRKAEFDALEAWEPG